MITLLYTLPDLPSIIGFAYLAQFFASVSVSACSRADLIRILTNVLLFSVLFYL